MKFIIFLNEKDNGWKPILDSRGNLQCVSDDTDSEKYVMNYRGVEVKEGIEVKQFFLEN